MAKKVKELTLMEQLLKLHSEEPNDMEFGGEVRKIVWKYIEENNPPY